MLQSTSLFLSMLAMAAVGVVQGTRVDTVDICFIFGMSALLAGVGGFASSLRDMRTKDKVNLISAISSIVNMACFGASVSMFSLWFLGGEPTIGNAIGIIGFCGILGIAGEPLLTPLVGFIYEVANRFLPEKKDK